jgi:hypothetical protein
MEHIPEPTVQEQIQDLIEEEVTRGLSPYRRLDLPEDVIAEMERVLRFALRTHPTARHLLRRLVFDPIVVKSEEVDTSGLDAVMKKSEGA